MTPLPFVQYCLTFTEVYYVNSRLCSAILDGFFTRPYVPLIHWFQTGEAVSREGGDATVLTFVSL